TQHPYRWPTIGKDLSHIEKATIEDVKAFFYQFYTPNNAVLVVAGAVQSTEVKKLSERWFSPIPTGPFYQRNIIQEPTQTSPKSLQITAEVPLNALYKAYHMPGRLSPDYHAVGLMAEILGGGKSSRLYKQLIDTKQYFNTIGACTTESVDPGLCIISGRLNNGVSFETAEEAIQATITTLQHQAVAVKELEKVQNQAKAHQVFSAVDLLHRAQELAMATILGDTNLVNLEIDSIQKVVPADIQRTAQSVFSTDNCSTLYYQCKA
ncbi:MAG: insulinase family protein, partial [Amoebophilaceae bacterium]|nr:insulinase family protein [Amoebophilaceae bacterium]